MRSTTPRPISPPPVDAPLATASRFLAGGVVTAAFSASLIRLSKSVPAAEVLITGMVVPSFTWVVHLALATLLLPRSRRDAYQGDLGRACLLGSVALLPAAAFNVIPEQPPRWPSAANVLISVAAMAILLFRRSAARGSSFLWPAGWCVTIACNMALFVALSDDWWGSATPP